MSDGGKGSAPRPLSVTHEKFDNNFRGIFGLSRLEKKRLQELNALSNQDNDYDKVTRYNEETQEVKNMSL